MTAGTVVATVHGPLSEVANEPHAFLARIPRLVVHADHGRRGVEHVLQRRAVDGRELGLAVRLRREACALDVDARRGRNLICDQRLLCLARAGDRSLHVFLGAAVGYLREVLRQTLCGDELPGAVGRFRAEPAPAQQHIRLLVGEQLEDVRGRVLHVQQRGPADRDVIGLAFRNDELGRRDGDDDLRSRPGSERRSLLRLGVFLPFEQIDLAQFARGCLGLGRVGGRCLGHAPRPAHRGCFHVAVEHMQVELARRILEQQHARVHDAREIRPFDRNILRLTIDVHEQRRLLHEDDARRSILERLPPSPWCAPAGWPAGLPGGRAKRI